MNAPRLNPEGIDAIALLIVAAQERVEVLDVSLQTEAQRSPEHGEGLERGEVRDDCGAYMSLDDIPCFTCKRAPKDGVEFVMCDKCAYWHCCECGCPRPEPSENEEK